MSCGILANLSHEAMALVSAVQTPIRALPNPRLPETENEMEMAARRVLVKEEEGEERESVVGFPPNALESSLDNAYLTLSDDDDDDDDEETRSDDSFPSLSEIIASNAPGAPVTPGSSSE